MLDYKLHLVGTVSNDFRCQNPIFNGAIIDNLELVDYLKQQGARKEPDAISSRQELEQQLKEHNFHEESTRWFLEQ